MVSIRSLVMLFLPILVDSARPNIILIVTDDQDDILGGVDAMPVLAKELINKGTRFTNSFVTTPICCPSRASILTGTYVHNNDVWKTTLNGNCGSQDWIDNEEPHTFAKLLKDAGYTTFFAGKYLNGYGHYKTGGASHVPVGWDWWNGKIGSNYYYDYSMSINGTEKKYGSDATDYMQTVISSAALNFIDVAAGRQPFLMYLCPTAPHGPFTPESKYASMFGGEKAPRTPNYNVYVKDHHWLISQPGLASGMPRWLIRQVDEQYRLRLQTLLSVDAMLQQIISKLTATNTLDNTYIIFSSDNGFHLGQFGIGSGKHQLYETDVRVPMVIRGPNVPVQTRTEGVLNIDLAPTILDLAGVSISSRIDGQSFQPLAQPGSPKRSWSRSKFLIEYKENAQPKPKDSRCPNRGPAASCSVRYNCVCLADPGNTYKCVRTLSGSENSVYCEFEDSVNFVEYFNMNSDPWQMKNEINTLGSNTINGYKADLNLLKACAGQGCNTVT